MFILSSNEVVINLEHKLLALIRLDDLRKQPGLILDLTVRDLRLVKVSNEDGAYNLTHVDLYNTPQSGLLLLVTKSARTKDYPHTISVH